jgi:hypothetical protein
MTRLTTDPGYSLNYVVPHEAFYCRVVNDVSVTVQKSADDGGCAWEFSVVEHPRIGIRVEVFDDAFAAFVEVPEFFTALAQSRRSNLDSVREILDDLGFEDATQRVERAR